jgi:flagellar biosynthesis/type III secretory pathway M-ring protein FliF/YscJ
MKLETMPARTRVVLGIGIVVILIASAVFAWWAMRTEYSVLFSRLTEADAAGIVPELRSKGGLPPG